MQIGMNLTRTSLVSTQWLEIIGYILEFAANSSNVKICSLLVVCKPVHFITAVPNTINVKEHKRIFFTKGCTFMLGVMTAHYFRQYFLFALSKVPGTHFDHSYS